MLANQIWRPISKPDYLCDIILRAKYYPTSDLLNAELKKGSCYTSQKHMDGDPIVFKKVVFGELGTNIELIYDVTPGSLIALPG